MQIETITTTTKSFKLELSSSQLCRALIAVGINVPPTAKFHAHIPGGDDWSNEDLEINANTPLVVTWTETTNS